MSESVTTDVNKGPNVIMFLEFFALFLIPGRMDHSCSCRIGRGKIPETLGGLCEDRKFSFRKFEGRMASRIRTNRKKNADLKFDPEAHHPDEGLA